MNCSPSGFKLGPPVISYIHPRSFILGYAFARFPQITEYELVLAFSSRELSDYITEKRPPPQLLGSNAVFKLMRQYFRYWSSEAGQHEPGGEYR